MPISNEHAISDLAWAAGFIDGDGMISVYQRSDRHNEFMVIIRAMNVNRIALDKLQAMFGGTVNTMHTAEKCRPRGWKPSFYWSASHSTAELAIRWVMPFLVLKRPQAELALEARSLVGQKWVKRSADQIRSLGSVCDRMRELNKRGQRLISR